MSGFNRTIGSVLLVCLIAGCSTSGGIYKKGDGVDGEFSPGKTVLSVVGVIAGVAAAAAMAKGGGGGYGAQGYAWDYQPGNGQWACRNKSNGEYAYEYQCAGMVKADYWP